MHIRLKHALFALVCLSIALSPLQAQSKKGGGGGGTTTLPSIRFEVQFLGTLGGDRSSVSGMNEAADIVGSSNDSQGVFRAARFIPGFGAVDLNVEMADLLAVRTDGPWTATSAVDINDWGQIVGSIKVLSLPNSYTHTFFYDPGDAVLARPRTLEILPLVRETTTRPVAINNWGQIAGNYSLPNEVGSFVYSPGDIPIDMGTGMDVKGMNDSGQVVFAKFGYESLRYTPNALLGDAGTYESFPFFCNFNSINSAGVLAGYKQVPLRKTINEYTAFRAAAPGSLQVLLRSSSSSVSTLCINDDNDAIVGTDGRSSLYTDMNGMGLINLDNLVVGTPAAVTKWREHFTAVRAMTKRYPVDATSSYPVMSGTAGLPNQACVLVPRLP